MMSNNKINNSAPGAQLAINTAGGDIHQKQYIIHVDNLGIHSDLPDDVKEEIKAAANGQGLTRVRLSDFVGVEQATIENRKFENIDILGPVVIYPIWESGIVIRGCSWFGAIDSAFIAIPDEKHYLQGVIGIRGCQFINCVFRNVAIAVKASDMPKIKEGFIEMNS